MPAWWALLACLSLVPARTYAYRPFVSTDAAVADLHVVEIELGYFKFERLREGAKTFSVPHVVLNYGFLEDWELVGEVMLSKPTDMDVQVTDANVMMKHVLREGVLQGRDGLSFAIEAGPLLPSTVDDERGFGFEGSGILSGHLLPFVWHLNFGGGVARETAEAYGLWGLIVELPMWRDLRLVSEVNGETAGTERADTSGLVGFIWQRRENLALDAGIRKGFGSAAVDWAVTVGLTFSFPVSREDSSPA